MLEIVVATQNLHKVEEIRAILGGLDVRLRSLRDLGVLDAPEEDRPTLEGNAAKKALVAAARTALLAIADDTGLEVDALGGAPGVRSARFAGEAATYADNNRRLLAELERVPGADRRARFRCVAAAARPAHPGEAGDEGTRARLLVSVDGVCEGTIARAARGQGGFGYDPIFVVSGPEKTFAELAADEKNRVSHRGRAFRRLRERLEGLLAAEGAAPSAASSQGQVRAGSRPGPTPHRED